MSAALNRNQLRTRFSSAVIRTLLRVVPGKALERFFVALGHRYPYTLIARGTIIEELLPHLVGPDLVAELSDGAKLSVPLWREGASLYVLGCLMAERPTTSFLRRAIRRGDLFVDVGANLGFYTFMAAMLCGPEGEVHAFEPQPALVGHLKRSVELNRIEQSVTIVPSAVGELETSEVTLFLADDPVHNTGAASTFRHQWLHEETAIRVSSQSIDAYAARCGLRRIDVMKIDVEGGEIRVLRGMTRLLRSDAPPSLIVLELFPALQPEQDPIRSKADDEAAKPHELIELLAGYGYEVYQIGDRGQLIRGFPIESLRTLASTPNVAFASPSLLSERPDLFTGPAPGS